MRKYLAGLLIIALLLVASSSMVMAQNIRIGLSLPSLSMTWFAFLKDAVEAQAAEMGVTVVAIDARNDVSKQMNDIEDMIVQGLDGVLLVPINAMALVPAVEELNSVGIPVVTVDRSVSGAEVLSHVGADNVEGGRIAGRFIAELLGGQGKVVELTGTPGSSPAIDRGRGFNEIIAQYPGIEIIAQQTGQFTRSDGMSVMENILQAHSQIDAVFAHNDDMIVGALEAIRASGISYDQIITAGFDAIHDGLRAVKDGSLNATIEQFPGGQAATAFKVLVEYIRDGITPAKEIYIEPALVTKETFDVAEKAFEVQ